ncbi:MAG TPA: RHS repeat-associated core domain-containing protein [Xanthomonadaceae bacterium]|jgi:RHS repeat-associated protein
MKWINLLALMVLCLASSLACAQQAPISPNSPGIVGYQDSADRNVYPSLQGAANAILAYYNTPLPNFTCGGTCWVSSVVWTPSSPGWVVNIWLPQPPGPGEQFGSGGVTPIRRTGDRIVAPLWPKPPGDHCDVCEVGAHSTGDPIEIATGNMHLEETDFLPRDSRMRFSRAFNSSLASLPTHEGAGWNSLMGGRRILDGDVGFRFVTLFAEESSTYGTASDACTLGWSEIVAGGASHNADPQWAGVTAAYDGAGHCNLSNGQTIPVLSDDPSVGLVYSVAPEQRLVTVERSDGAIFLFYCSKGVCKSSPNAKFGMTVDANGYSIVDDRGNTERYDNFGLLSSITWKDGYQQTFVQGGDGISTGYFSAVSSVTDNLGRSIVFSYDKNELLSLMSLPDGSTVGYHHDSLGRLTSVTYPTGTRTYQYTDSNSPNALTGVVDENTTNSIPYETWSYDANGLAIGSANAGLTANAPVNQFLIQRNTDGSATVTDPLLTRRTFTFQSPFGVAQETSISGPVCFDCDAGVTSTYDSNGYLSGSTDWNGNHTAYQFDAAGQLHQRIDAQGASVQRTTTIDWDDVLHNPKDQTVHDDVANKTVSQAAWTYNPRGEPLTLTRTDPVTNATRTWTYTYCETVTTGCPLLGLLTSVDGPRTDVPDITTYTYFPSDAPSCAGAPQTCPYRMGDLQAINNALGQTTTFLTYDGAGRPLSLTDVNGVETDLQYNARGWLTQVARRAINGASGSGDQVTGYAYYPDGQLQTLTRPDGASATFTYDAAHRLTDIADNLGDTIHYTLDAAGNRTEEDIKDPSGNPKRIVRRQFNALGQLAVNANAALNGSGGLVPNMSYTYDANGNPHLATDGRDYVTDNTPDALNRLQHVVQDEGDATHVNAHIDITHDALDRITQVTDPQGLNTTYQYDGLGNLTQLTSPDTGTTTIVAVDAAGNVKTRKDARNVTSTYTYDALNRVKTIHYPNTALNVTYTWDTVMAACSQPSQAYPVGRVSQIQDGSGYTRFCYDRFGNLARKVNVINGTAFQTNYAYDLAHHLTQVTTPKSTIITYARDAIGRVIGVTYKLSGGTTKTVVSNVTYYPYGPVASITYGDGRVLNRSYDQDYVVSSISDTGTGGLNLGFGRDLVGNLTSLTSGSSANTLAYDGLDRLTRVADPNQGDAQVAAWTYDATGNRLTQQAGTGSPVSYYTYPTGSHQLIATGPVGSPVTRGYDAMGNTTAIGTNAQGFHYDDTGRMDQTTTGAANTVQMQYATNALGQRVEKYLTGNSAATLYTIRDEQGQVLAEYDGSNTRVHEVMWMDGMPVGVVSGTTLSYLEPDQLGTPRVAIDGTSNSQTWSWSPVGDPFGQGQPTGSLNLDLRMPGQVYDAESGLNYNYFRDYDSASGRELESDPAGLDGGISTYGYVAGNPLSLIDPFGLKPGDVFANPDCAAVDMMQFLMDNSSSVPGAARFNSGYEYGNDIVSVPGGYTYGNHFDTDNDRFHVTPGPQPPNYYAYFHTHDLIPREVGNLNNDFSRPGQVSGEPNGGDLSAANRAAYGNQYVGALQRTGTDASGRVIGAPFIHKNNGKSPKSVLVNPKGCGCGH